MIVVCGKTNLRFRSLAYRKIIVDNPVCMRRFHLACDDEAGAAESPAELRCPHCQVVIFKTDGQSAVHFLREENLTKVTALSSQLINDCALQDNFQRSPRGG